MTIAKKIDGEIFISFMIITVVSSFYFFNMHRQKSSLEVTMPVSETHINPTVSVKAEPLLPVETAMQPTPDGTKHLVMKVTHTNDGNSEYTFSTVDVATGTETVIYSASGSATKKFGIPFNAWSPDNQYFFIQKSDNDALVFRADNENIIPEEKYLDVAEIFNEGKGENWYYETTGWASNTLLILNTTDNGKKSSSYWFEVPSKAVIELSDQY